MNDIADNVNNYKNTWFEVFSLRLPIYNITHLYSNSNKNDKCSAFVARINFRWNQKFSLVEYPLKSFPFGSNKKINNVTEDVVAGGL